MAFTNGNDAQRARVMEIASGWSDHANVQFERVDDGNDPTPDIRVSFDQNRHWSRVGTDSRLSTEAGNASMEFIGFNPGGGSLVEVFVVLYLCFLDFHLFSAAMQLPVAATGYDKFCTTHRADISFSNLICHVF